jgi:PKD repeat protein
MLRFVLVLTVLFAGSVYAKPQFAIHKQIAAPCDRSELSGQIGCAVSESYLQIKEKMRNTSNKLETYLKLAKREVRFYLAKIPFSSITNLLPDSLLTTTNLPPVIHGPIKSYKYGNGVNPYVSISLEDGFSDPDGYIKKVTWNLEDGTIIELNEGEFSSTANIGHIFKESNHYVVSFTVEDDQGATKSVTAYVETPENAAANVAITATAPSANNVLFNIVANDDDGTSFRYLTFVCDTVHTSSSFYCNFGSPGTKNIYTEITDSNNVSTGAFSTVTVNGTTVTATPTAMLRASTLYGEAPLTVDFDATKSFDINGQIVSYRWEFEDWGRPQNYSAASKISHTFVKPGTYRVTLYVKDNDGNESNVGWDIFVASNSATEPHIVANYNGSNSIKLDSSVSSLSVPADAPMTYWDFGDGTKISGKWPEHTYSAPGTYNVKLKVVDILGETHIQEKSITVGSSDDSPIASHSVSSYQFNPGQFTILDGSGSSDPGLSEPLEYRWVLDDGEQAEESVISKTFEDRGIYGFELWVTNSRGFSSRSSGSVQVKDPFTLLEAKISSTPKVDYGPFTVNLDGSSTLAKNPIVYQEWETDHVISYESTAEFETQGEGNQYFRYYVRDSLGNESMEFGHVMALAPGSIPSGNQSPVAVITQYSHDEDPRKFDFNCESSTDSDDYIAFCEWKVNGKSLTDNNWVQTSFPEDRLYTIQLTVTDNWGAQSTVYRQFNFSPAPVELITFDSSPYAPIISETIKFGAENSTIPGKDITAYEWDFGDGSTATGRTTTHSYSAAGSYSVVLTVTDSDSAEHTSTKTIVVTSSLGSFGINMSARDQNFSGRVGQSGTYKTLGAPEKIYFNVDSTPISPKVLTEAQWDFGDGQIAFGREVEHTYHKPGTYEVEVTAKDVNGNSESASMTVVVTAMNGCLGHDGETMCLSDQESDIFNVSSFQDVWTLDHNLGSVDYSTNPSSYPKDWAKIITKDGSGIIYDVSTAVTTAGNTLQVHKNLLPKELNLNFPYELKIAAKSTSNMPLIGTWPFHYIGTSRLTINSNQTGVKLQVHNPGAQFRKDIDLDSSTSVSLENIPAGEYALIAEKDGKSLVQTINLSGTQSVAFDMGGESKKLLRAPAAMFSVKKLKNLQKSLKSNGVWTQSLCGEPTPFPVTKMRRLESGETKYWSFTSALPQGAATFQDVPSAFNKKIKLSCAIKSPGLLYGQNKWKYKDGPNRCWNDKNPHYSWTEYLKSLDHENSPVVIKYELKDDWSSEKVSGQFVTSSQGLMEDKGLSLEDLSARIGLPDNDEQDWNQRVNYEISVPAQFVRPQVKFELYSHHDSSTESFYSVECDVLNSDTSPRLAEISAVSLNNSANSSEENGRLSLTEKFGFFPVQFDGRSSSPLSLHSDIAKASYKAEINYQTRSDVTWQAVEVKFTYGSQTSTEIYDFVGTPVTNTYNKTYSNQFVIDTEALEGKFSWVKGVGDMEMTVTPLGRVSSDHDFRGEPKAYTFKALFDLQAEKNSSQVCSNGFYPDNFSAFGRDEFLSLLTNLNFSGGNVRCGDVSLPFGGPFNLSSSWKHLGHEFGMEGKIRSFNTTTSTQDAYDGISPSSQRVDDLMAYMTFSNSLDVVMSAQYEEVNGQPSDKKKIVNYCNPESGSVKAPCTVGTTFSNITKKMLHEICLMNSTATNERPSGCPVPSMSNFARFSRWVELNSFVFSNLLKGFSFDAQMASGFFNPVSSILNLDWQKKALAYGQWPDDMPIFKADEATNIFVINHLDNASYPDLEKMFVRSTAQLDSISIKTGWK